MRRPVRPLHRGQSASYSPHKRRWRYSGPRSRGPSTNGRRCGVLLPSLRGGRRCDELTGAWSDSRFKRKLQLSRDAFQHVLGVLGPKLRPKPNALGGAGKKSYARPIDAGMWGALDSLTPLTPPSNSHTPCSVPWPVAPYHRRVRCAAPRRRHPVAAAALLARARPLPHSRADEAL